MEPLTQHQEDVLADILQSIHLHGDLYCRATMSAPWGFMVATRDVVSFHLVTGGSCWLKVTGTDKLILLTEGDLVILPHGHAHTLSDDPRTPVTELEEIVARQPTGKDGRFRYGGNGKATMLVCGGFQFQDRITNPLLPVLPAFIHLRSNGDPS